MVMTDPIADYLTRIRNANMAKHTSVEIPASSMKKSLSEILGHASVDVTLNRYVHSSYEMKKKFLEKL